MKNVFSFIWTKEALRYIVLLGVIGAAIWMSIAAARHGTSPESDESTVAAAKHCIRALQMTWDQGRRGRKNAKDMATLGTQGAAALIEYHRGYDHKALDNLNEILQGTRSDFNPINDEEAARLRQVVFDAEQSLSEGLAPIEVCSQALRPSNH